MTDRQVSRRFFQRYAKPDANETAEQFEAMNRKAVEEFNEKSIEQRRAEYFAFCRTLGHSDAKIEAAWKNYLETGKM